MNKEKFSFSEKSWDFIETLSNIDMLEGTARSSKSTGALFKLGLMINRSRHNQHFISATSSVVARRNLIDIEKGFKDLFKGYVRDGTDTKKGNHLIFKDSKGKEKIIYILGFGDKARWKDVLGSTMGCGMIDEINTADQDFINEVFRSFFSVPDYYLVGTLNPDNPDKPIYKSLINRCRPLKKYLKDIPVEIIKELKKTQLNPETPPLKNAYYWHFNFNDNPIMDDEQIEAMRMIFPVDSFFYKSKMLGLRGVAEGVIFAKSMQYEYLILQNNVDEMLRLDQFVKYSIAVDLGNNDTKKGTGTITTFSGITKNYKELICLDSFESKSTEALDLAVEISDGIINWLDKIQNLGKLDAIWIDGYGAEGVMLGTIRRVLRDRKYGQIEVKKAIKFGKEIADREARMIMQLILYNERRILFANNKGAKRVSENLKKIVYDDKTNLPLDVNQLEMDYYDSFSYTYSPYIAQLGGTKLTDYFKNKDVA